VRIISYQLIDRGYKKKDQVEILELKSTITEIINNSLEGLTVKGTFKKPETAPAAIIEINN